MLKCQMTFKHKKMLESQVENIWHFGGRLEGKSTIVKLSWGCFIIQNENTFFSLKAARILSRSGYFLELIGVFFFPQKQTALLIMIVWIVAGLGQLLHRLSGKKKKTFRNLFYVQEEENGNYKWDFSSLRQK